LSLQHSAAPISLSRGWTSNKTNLTNSFVFYRLRANSCQNSREYNSHVKELVAAMLGERQETSFYNKQYICLPTPGGGVNAQRSSSKANRAASELLKRLPNHRFISSTIVEVCIPVN
jgi:hypothetical protein